MTTQYSKCGAYAYISTPADTTTTVAGDWYRLEGTFTNERLKGFTITNDKLTYLGQRKPFMIVIQGSFMCDTNSTTVTLGIFKNGSLETNSLQSVKINTNTDTKFIGTCDCIPLEASNDIELRIKSDKAGAVIRAITLTTLAKE